MARYLLWVALCCLPFRVMAAQDLLDLFPDPAEIARGIDRGDPVETALWQQNAIDTLSMLAGEVTPRGANGQPAAASSPLLDRYWQERSAASERGMAALRGNAGGPAAEAAARAEYDRRAAEFVPGPEFLDLTFGRLPPPLRAQFREEERQVRLNLRMQHLAARLPGLESGQGMKPMQRWSGAELAVATQLLLLQATMSLPKEWQPHAQRVALVPASVWLALLLAWLAWGIWRAVRRFGFDPQVPGQFWNGPRRYRFDASVGQVIDVHERTTVTQTTTYTTATDGFGNQHTTPRTSFRTTEKQRIHLRQPDGTERVVPTTDFELPVRVGQHLLDVAAYKGRAKTGPWVFYHIYDMDQTFCRDALRDVVKMRPRVFIPFVLLSAALAIAVLGYTGWYALLAAPIVYAVTLKVINNGRLRRFRQQFIPQIVSERSQDIRNDYIPVPGGGGLSRA